jgi:uncharacterized membrane protein
MGVRQKIIYIKCAPKWKRLGILVISVNICLILWGLVNTLLTEAVLFETTSSFVFYILNNVR